MRTFYRGENEAKVIKHSMRTKNCEFDAHKGAGKTKTEVFKK